MLESQDLVSRDGHETRHFSAPGECQVTVVSRLQDCDNDADAL